MKRKEGKRTIRTTNTHKNYNHWGLIMFSWSQMHWEFESSRTHPDTAIKCFLANYLPVQLFTSCGGFMLNPVISLALQLPLSMTRSKPERLQSAFYYTTCEWRFDPMSDHLPPLVFMWARWAFPYKSPGSNELLLFFLSFQLYYFVCVSASFKNKPHDLFFSLTVVTTFSSYTISTVLTQNKKIRNQFLMICFSSVVETGSGKDNIKNHKTHLHFSKDMILNKCSMQTPIVADN